MYTHVRCGLVVEDASTWNLCDRIDLESII